MKTTIAVATFVLLATGAAVIGAVDLKGSDTMGQLTEGMLLGSCLGTSGIVYEAGGSSAGEVAMISGMQQVAPMSRPLTSHACELAINSNSADHPATAYNILCVSRVWPSSPTSTPLRPGRTRSAA